MANLIVQENLLPGNPSSEWDLASVGYTTIEGFTTDISVNRGQMVSFKINTAATSFRIDIYRLGYYGGLGARKIITLQQTASVQPAPVVNGAIGLVDAGNWSVTASWAVPAAAVSGVYLAHLVRQDGTVGENHIPFIVRDDGALHDIVFQTSDPTWHAYNGWGGYSLYGGSTAEFDGRAYKVSYNRPIATRDGVGVYAGPQDSLFGEEIAAIHWLEANGYDVSYIAGVDTDRRGSELLNHKAFISCGHDEYWSGAQRANVEAARSAGIHLAFWSGNEVFWKTRYESSAVTVDGSPTTYRTLVCYKETRDNAPIDPSDPPTCTCTWRDPRFSPPGDAGRPENALTGTIFMVDDFREDQILIPYPMTKLRFWRNTAVANTAPGQSGSLVKNYLGYEWDEAPDNGFAPAGLVRLSSTTLSVNTYLLDYGTIEGPGIATHSLTLYRAASGAIVFGAGTVMWAWGLDPDHDPDPDDTTQTPTDPNVKQAMVNLLADMGIQPASMQPGLVAATASTDTTPPVTVITAPASGATLTQNLTFTITGTSTDVGGLVAGVEVSTDGGQSWHPATGTTSWSYNWAPGLPGSYAIRARATDDSLNIENPGPTVSVTVAGTTGQSLFSGLTPTVLAVADPNSVELGVQFVSTLAGTITALRFYKGVQNTGPHTATLWTAAGTSLASVAFTSESASGWQQITLPTPISISANTTYVASYHTPGNYSADNNYFTTSGQVSGALTAPATGATSGGNGVYAYGSSSVFPTNTFQGSNYWVDVVFNPGGTVPPVAVNDSGFVTTQNVALAIQASQLLANDHDPNNYALSIQSVSAPVNGSVSYSTSTLVVTFVPTTGYTGPANFTYTITNGHGGTASANVALTVNPATTSPPPVANNDSGFTTVQNTSLTIPASQLLANDTDPSGFTLSILSVGGAVNGTVSYSASALSVTFVPTTGYVGPASFTYTITNGHAGTASASVSLTVNQASGTTYSLFAATSKPSVVTVNDTGAVELGVKFQSSAAGRVTAIRFYKGPKNLGTHTAHLWNAAGTLLATATFSGETASGWQQVTLATPIAIAANATYVASYYTSRGFYSADNNFFASGRTSGSLSAPASGTSGGNGVYVYGSGGKFPGSSYLASNYWVDVVFVVS